MHEEGHTIHEDRLINKFGGKKVAKKIDQVLSESGIEKYQRKYKSKILQICDYALEGPLEAVACDLSNTITSSLDKTNLMPTQNPFIGSPYERLSITQKIPEIFQFSQKDLDLQVILRNFWNGRFE